MAGPEPHEHVFVVRLWREPREVPNMPTCWRGSVRHLGPAEDASDQRYFDDLRRVPAIIREYLVDVPEQSDLRSRVRQWLTRIK